MIIGRLLCCVRLLADHSFYGNKTIEPLRIKALVQVASNEQLQPAKQRKIL